jgi:DNA-binding transcriptional regulator GbsR (MarR family)
MPFNFDAAKQDGLSDEAIKSHLESLYPNFDISSALKEGVDLKQISEHLTTQGGEYNANQDQSQANVESNEQRKSDEQKRSATEAGLQPSQVRLPELTRPKERVGNIDTSGQVKGGEITSEENIKTDRQGTQEGSQDGKGLRGQVPPGNQEEVVKGGVQPPAPTVLDKASELAGLFSRGAGKGLAEAGEFGVDVLKRQWGYENIESSAKQAEAIFGKNKYSDFLLQTPEKIKEEYKKAGTALDIKPSENESILNGLVFGAGKMLPDLAMAIATEGGSEAATLERSVVEPIWKSIAEKATHGMRAFSPAALVAANTAINEDKENGKDDSWALQTGIKKLIETEAGAAVPMQVSSAFDNVLARGISRVAQSVPLSVMQSEIVNVANNMLVSEKSRKPTISENIISGNFTEAGRQVAEAAPMALMGIIGERSAANKAREADLPMTAGAIEKNATEDVIKPIQEKAVEAVAQAESKVPDQRMEEFEMLSKLPEGDFKKMEYEKLHVKQAVDAGMPEDAASYFVKKQVDAGLTPFEITSRINEFKDLNEKIDASRKAMEENSIAESTTLAKPPSEVKASKLEEASPYTEDKRDDAFIISADKDINDAPAYQLSTKKTEHGMEVEWVRANEQLRGKGIGLELYKKAFEDAQSRNMDLVSDVSVTQDSLNVYKKLESDGYKVEYNPNIKEVLNASGQKTIVSTDKNPVAVVKSAPKQQSPEGSRIAAAAYLAPDGKTYEGSSHLDAMQKAKEAGAITQEEVDAKQTPESRNTEEFGYAVTLPDGTRTTTTREAGAEIARASGQAQEEPFTFGEKMHSNETKKDDFPETKAGEEIAPPPAGSGPTVMRGVSERIAGDKETSPELKYQIEADDLVKRKVLPDEDADAWVESVPSEHLETTFNKAMTSIGENENLSKLRVRLGSRFFNERLAAGDESGAGRIINLIAKTASDAASVLRSVQFLYKATPAGFQRLVQKMGEKAGVVIKDTTMQKVGDLSNDFLAKKKLHEDLANKAQNAGTKLEYRQTLKEMKKAGSEALKAQNKLFGYVDSIMPKSLSQDVIPTLIKGNLLTPISIATNIQANALRTVLDVPSMLTASGMDAARALLTGKKREFFYGPQEIAQYFKTLAANAPKMVADIGKSIIRAPLDIGETTNKAEIKQKLSPLSALKRLAQSKDDRLYEGSYSLKQRAADLAEGMFGLPANIMFDPLAAGDAPFRTAAKRMAASSIARQIGLKGLEYEKFLDLPEKGIREYAKKVGKDTSDVASIQRKLLSSYRSDVKKSVFEQDNVVAEKISNILNSLDKVPVVNILARATIPYVKTPLNVISELMEYTIWPYALGRGLHSIKNGKVKEGQQLLAKSAIGAITAYGAAYLVKNGVLTPPADPRSKEKELGYATMPESSLNISGIQRLINGESGAVQEGDTIVRADKIGLLGGILVTSALRQKMKEQTTLMEGQQSIDSKLFNEATAILPKTLSFALNQTFLKGTNDLLTSITRGEGDQWMKGIFSSVISAVLPGTLSAISRATREYMPDAKDDSLYKSLENTIRDRLGFAGAMKDVPLKLDFWGRPIKQTPEGANPIFYNFLDMSKSRSIPNDPVSLEMLHLFHATGNKEIIPPVPQKKFTLKNTTYGLTPDEYTSYAQKVGQERRRLMERLVSSPSYLRMSDERKAEAFQRNIALGKKIGTSKFLREVREAGGLKGQVMKLSPKELTQRILEQRAETKAEEALTSE